MEFTIGERKRLVEGETRVITYFAVFPAYLYREGREGEGVLLRPQTTKWMCNVTVKQQVMRVMDFGCYQLAWFNVEYV